MLEYIYNLNFEGCMNEDKLFDIFKTKSKKINSNLMIKIKKYEKTSNFFSEYTKQDINSISKTLHNLDIKLSKIIKYNDRINIKEIDNYITGLSKMIVLFYFLIKVKKIIAKKLVDIHQYLLNNFLYNESDEIYSQKYYQFDQIFKTFFNNYEKDDNSFQMKELENCDNIKILKKSFESPIIDRINKNILLEFPEEQNMITPQFKRGDSSLFNEQNNLTTMREKQNNNYENLNISFSSSNNIITGSISSTFTFKTLKYNTPKQNNKYSQKDINKTKVHKFKKNNAIIKSQINLEINTNNKNTILSNKGIDKKFNTEKNINNIFHINNKEVLRKNSNKNLCTKEIFVELFVLANELYKNNEITDKEKIIFKQLIINKSEKLLQIFINNKENKKNLIYSIKEFINKIMKNE